MSGCAQRERGTSPTWPTRSRPRWCRGLARAARRPPGPADPAFGRVRGGRARREGPLRAAVHGRAARDSAQSRSAVLSHLSAAVHHGWKVKTVPDAAWVTVRRHRRLRPMRSASGSSRACADLPRDDVLQRRDHPAAHRSRLRSGAALRRGARRRRLGPAIAGHHPRGAVDAAAAAARHRSEAGCAGSLPTRMLGRPTRSSRCCGRCASRRASSSLHSCRSPSPGCSPSSTSAVRSFGSRSRPTVSSTTAPVRVCARTAAGTPSSPSSTGRRCGSRSRTSWASRLWVRWALRSWRVVRAGGVPDEPSAALPGQAIAMP